MCHIFNEKAKDEADFLGSFKMEKSVEEADTELQCLNEDYIDQNIERGNLRSLIGMRLFKK